MKRSWRRNMGSDKPELTQTYGPGNGKRYKSATCGNSGIDSSSFIKRLENPQGSTTSANDSPSKETKKSIGRFFYENGLDFDVVSSPSFQRMLSLCSGQTKYQVPTRQELEGWILKDTMKEMHEYVDEIRNSWAETGCSILLDPWEDAEGRNLINILVDCPKGTVYLHSSDISDCFGNMDAMLLFFEKVLMEVGINNVVQIITSSTLTFMKEVGRQLMEKYRPIFWTVSASRCLGLMLEKLEGMDLIKETLDKAKIITRFIHSHPIALEFLRDQTAGRGLFTPSKIRSAQPFLTLENIVLERQILKTMFLSSDSMSSILTLTVEGKSVADMVADQSFWSGALTVIKAAIPLVRVIEWLNKSNKEQVGYIYETLDQVKEKIKEGLKHKKSQYPQFWKAVDDVWDELLHSPLHSAGYFLNPNLFYSSDVCIDPEVATGLFCCIVRMTGDVRVQDRITIQMERYRAAKGAFGVGCAVDKRSDISPALWWSKYGGECPELQRLAIRVLSQTSDVSSRFQLKRSLAKALFTKGRSPTELKRLADMVFLRYNNQLQNFGHDTIDDYNTSYEIDAMDDWLGDNKANFM